jgi:hypothetical protein
VRKKRKEKERIGKEKERRGKEKKRKSTNCEPTFKCHVLSGANSWIVARHIGHSASCTTQEEQKPL